MRLNSNVRVEQRADGKGGAEMTRRFFQHRVTRQLEHVVMAVKYIRGVPIAVVLIFLGIIAFVFIDIVVYNNIYLRYVISNLSTVYFCFMGVILYETVIKPRR